MCGIAGFLDFRAQTTQEAGSHTLNAMRKRLSHRGPNDHGHWFDRTSGIGLAHTRLSILDLSPLGHQPMSSPSGRYYISFNGEIYNFRDLKRELAAVGFAPSGGSDTEILLAAIEHWGLRKTLESTIGMFAFALWDAKTRNLHLARDRMGEKPLYYGWLGDEFVFGSELKALRAHPKWNQSIDKDALSLFMRYAYIPAPHTIYKGISKLMPACTMTIPGSNLETRTNFSPWPNRADAKIRPEIYWDLKDVARSGGANKVSSEKEAADTLETLLSDSIRNQLVADVPLGAFLSGGVDSSLVVALMQSLSSQPVKTFTIGFDTPGFDEAVFARDVAEHIGTDHSELYVSAEEAMSVIPTLASVYDEPHADSSHIPAILVSKLAQNSVTVSMSGDGGDELFCGYNRYLHSDQIWNTISRLPPTMRRLIAKSITAISPSSWDRVLSRVPGRLPRMGYKLQKLADSMLSNDLEDVYRRLISYWQDPAQLVLASNEPNSFFHSDFDLGESASFVEKMCYWDQIAYLPDDNLTKMDRASMSVGLETRAPLLDHNVVEYSWRISQDLKVSQNKGKWLLRQVLYRHVPERLIERPKMGFSVPIGEWLRGPLKEWCSDLLATETLQRQGYLNHELVHNAWRSHLAGKADNQNALWAVLMFQSWFDEYESQ